MTPARRPTSRSSSRSGGARPASAEAGTDAPRVDAVEPRGLVDGDAGAVSGHDELELTRLVDADLSGRDLEGATFRECVLEAPRLGGARLRGATLVETVVADSFAPELAAPRSTWRDVRVDRPRWGSAELYDATWQSVRVVGGKIDYLNLRGARLVDVVLEGCSIGELDLGGAEALRVALVDCRVGTLDVTRASLAHTDLRSTSFDRLDGLEGLRGATVDPAQLAAMAPLLAAHLGLVVD